MKNKWIGLGALALVMLLAGFARFHDLGHAATRSDEISQLKYAMGATTVSELWTNPPWLNQIPLTDSISALWGKIQPGRQADEKMVREPFAGLGWLTVVFCSIWAMRRRGAGAGMLVGIWMAVLPYHVYHSREAYYYVVTMLFSAAMALRGADFMAKLSGGVPLKIREYAEWTAWTLVACLCHMSVWVVAGMLWALLVWMGWKGLVGDGRGRHVRIMGIVTFLLAAGMSRWVYRAFLEMQRVASISIGHIGSDFGWVAPRVLPFFSGGGNAVGIGILLAVLVAAGWLLWRSRGRIGREDPLYAALMWSLVCGLTGSYLYIFGVGGDKAKLAYFAVNMPIFLTWAGLTLDKAFARAGEGRRLVLDAGASALIAGLLILPMWQVMRIDGKPAAYRQIRSWLDSQLEPGSVVIVDRWLEPWNEMALYSPSNVTVTFTIPDEPYESYVSGNWRKTTKELFERNGAQAFMRLSRNHENRMGLWTWPETWFQHRAVVTNEAGVWLRDTGFCPMEEFYSEKSRVETEIFYDTHEDIAARAKGEGRDVVWFFGEGFRVFKPWQQGDFADYRVLEGEADLEIRNLSDGPMKLRGEVVAAAMNGNAVVQIGSLPTMTFPAGQLASKRFELDLPAGVSHVPWKNMGSAGALAIRELRLGR